MSHPKGTRRTREYGQKFERSVMTSVPVVRVNKEGGLEISCLANSSFICSVLNATLLKLKPSCLISSTSIISSSSNTLFFLSPIFSCGGFHVVCMVWYSLGRRHLAFSCVDTIRVKIPQRLKYNKTKSLNQYSFVYLPLIISEPP